MIGVYPYQMLIYSKQIYNNIKDSKARDEFIEKWQKLAHLLNMQVKVSKAILLLYVYLRALENDRKTTTQV